MQDWSEPGNKFLLRIPLAVVEAHEIRTGMKNFVQEAVFFSVWGLLRGERDRSPDPIAEAEHLLLIELLAQNHFPVRCADANRGWDHEPILRQLKENASCVLRRFEAFSVCLIDL